ncbi:MAG TPA: XdhC/CoxI family protein [Thermoanaerobaculia bacterium]|jgi:xanthine dehydrogenase accessory factor|nr:XdhC/CoxI family protein [Thermoanaerobaculia bacterium]
MSSDDAFFRELTDELEKRGRLALATVLETKGSGPSRIGRRFLIFEDGTFRGTIGGGPFEALVVADAGALFREEDAVRLLKWYDFFERELESPELREPTNMICGGSARVAIELLKASPSLVILGGGHVGKALARLARDLAYDVTVGDDRDEYIRSDRFPAGVKAVRTSRNYELPPDALLPGRDRYVAVVSRCWETDLAALRPWLAPGAPPARYLGLIGSARKVRGVLARLAEEGVPEEKLSEIRAPIGLSIGAVTPEEIAVSILAEVTAVRRGAANPGYAWRADRHRTATRVSNT